MNGRKIKKIAAFAVLLLTLGACGMGKSARSVDSAAKAQNNIPNTPDTLSFHITKANNIVFSAILDEKDTVDLFFDSGATDIILKHESIRENTSLLEGRNEGYAEEDYEPLEGVYSLTLGRTKWDSLTIFPVSVGPGEADGHFGWDLFENKVLELDYENNRMIVHEHFPGDLAGYSKSKMEFINTLFCIQGSIRVGENNYANRYLFDLGFQRAVILDKNLREAAEFPDDLPVIKETVLRNSVGTKFVNRVVEVEKICFGGSCAASVPVQLLSTPNPARFETHILGGEILKRFNTVLDFRNGYVYLKPNALMDLPYADGAE